MAIFQNNAEGLTAGTTIAANQSGSGTVFSNVASVGAPTYIYTNTQAAHDTQSYQISGTTSDNLRLDIGGSSVSASAARVYVRFATLPSAATDLIQVRNTSGQLNAGLGMNASGQVQVKDNSATLYTFSTSLSVNTWYRFELQLTVGDGTGTVGAAIYVFDDTSPIEPAYSGTNLHTTNASASLFRVGKITTATSFSAFFDDIAWDNGTSNQIGPKSNIAPSATAGLDRTNIEPYTTVALNGNDADSDGTIVARNWSQVSGSPTVILSGSGASRTYIAPGTLSGTTLVFNYQVTDNSGETATSSVTHAIAYATERVVIGGVQVPVNAKVVSGGGLI